MHEWISGIFYYRKSSLTKLQHYKWLIPDPRSPVLRCPIVQLAMAKMYFTYKTVILVFFANL